MPPQISHLSLRCVTHALAIIIIVAVAAIAIATSGCGGGGAQALASSSPPLSASFQSASVALDAELDESDDYRIKQPPMPFTDFLLPPERQTGAEIDILGRVTLLPGFKPVNSVERLTTRFSLHSRLGSVSNIEFKPQVANASSAHQKTGNFLASCPYDLSNVTSEVFNVSHKTIIMIAGYLTNDRVEWVNEARTKWLELEDVNVIHVTWSDSNKWMYSSAVSHTPLVARQIVILLYYLAAMNGHHFRDKRLIENVHFVGHSLGAHIGGFVGKDLGGTLGRITGLDPAGPAFDEFTSEFRLDKSDARFVDIIHTNSGVMKKLNALGAATMGGLDTLLNKLPLMERMTSAIRNEYSGEGDTAWFGIDKNIGHVDYYANNGRTQPGCSGLLHICDHGRAHDILNDILRHELSLKDLGFTKEQRKANRLMAFPAQNYESFLSGANLKALCPNLMNMGQHLSDAAADTMSSCSIPLDLLTPAEELHQELKEKYNIDRILADQVAPKWRQYFFRTLSSEAEMLVGDHYLLKLYLTDRPIWNEDVCSLEVKIKLSDQFSVDINLQSLVKSRDGSLPTTIAMPFIQPFGPQTRAVIDELGVPSNKTETNKISPELWDDFKHMFLPERLTITIGDVKAKGVFQTVKNKLVKLFSSMHKDCSLKIGMVEIHPVVAHRQNFAGIYGFEGTQIPENQKLHIYTLEQQVKVPWIDEQITTLESDNGLLSTSRKLVGLVVDA